MVDLSLLYWFAILWLTLGLFDRRTLALGVHIMNHHILFFCKQVIVYFLAVLHLQVQATRIFYSQLYFIVKPDIFLELKCVQRQQLANVDHSQHVILVILLVSLTLQPEHLTLLRLHEPREFFLVAPPLGSAFFVKDFGLSSFRISLVFFDLPVFN